MTYKVRRRPCLLRSERPFFLISNSFLPFLSRALVLQPSQTFYIHMVEITLLARLPLQPTRSTTWCRNILKFGVKFRLENFHCRQFLASVPCPPDRLAKCWTCRDGRLDFLFSKRMSQSHSTSRVPPSSINITVFSRFTRASVRFPDRFADGLTAIARLSRIITAPNNPGQRPAVHNQQDKKTDPVYTHLFGGRRYIHYSWVGFSLALCLIFTRRSRSPDKRLPLISIQINTAVWPKSSAYFHLK